MMSDCLWLGGHGFGERDDGSISSLNYNLVSSLDADSFDNPMVRQARSASGINRNGRSTDLFGYTRARYEELGEVVTGSIAQYFLKSRPSPTISPANGLVEFQVKISDMNMATNNAFGGIMTMGLYSLDYRKMLSNGIPFTRSIDKDVDTGDDMEFRLFSRKVFNESITATNDNPPTNSALEYNTALLIKWRLEFV